MKRQRVRSRIYWRERGGARRAYGDFRDYADVGGGREALVAQGENLATTDATTAQVLVARRLEHLDGIRRGRAIHGIAKQTTLAAFCREHLIAKAKAGRVTEGWVAADEHFLGRAVEHFGADRELSTITAADVRAWAEQLQTIPNGRGGTMSGGTVRHHLNALSNVFRRAQAEGAVVPGYNPVDALLDKPRAARREAKWLEVHEAALLLEAARTYVAARVDRALPFAYPLLATFLLTGGRESEVLGLEVDDVSFDRKTVTFRPNAWRRLKTASSFRSVPLWPQLEEILRPYVFGTGRPPFAVPVVPHGRGVDAHRLPQAPRRCRRAGWLAAWGDPLQDVPAHLLRGAATDARPRGAGERVHGEPGARARRGSDDPQGVRPPGTGSAPCGRRGVSSGDVQGPLGR